MRGRVWLTCKRQEVNEKVKLHFSIGTLMVDRLFATPAIQTPLGNFRRGADPPHLAIPPEHSSKYLHHCSHAASACSAVNQCPPL